MMDLSALGLAAAQTPHHGGKRDKAGASHEDGKEPKSFADLVTQAKQQARDRKAADQDAAEVRPGLQIDADLVETDMAVDAEAAMDPLAAEATADVERSSNLTVDVEAADALELADLPASEPAAEPGEEGVDAEATADQESRIRISTNIDSLVKRGTAPEPAQQTVLPPIEATTEKVDNKITKNEKISEPHKFDAKIKESPSEELSRLLGMPVETAEDPDAATEIDATEQAPETVTAGPVTFGEDAVAAATEMLESPAVVTAEATSVAIATEVEAAAFAGTQRTDLPRQDHATAVVTTEAEAEQPADTSTVRIVAADGKAKPLDLDVTLADKSDTPLPGADDTDFVTVLDARRYLGFSNDGNAQALTAAIKSDPTWTHALQQASQLGHRTATEVNTLKLQMNPDNLGMMTASLRLKGDELMVEVRVETVEAYRQLSSDHDGLVKALKDQGFNIDQVTIQLTASSRPESGQDGNTQGGNGQNLKEGSGENTRQREENSRRATNQNEWMSDAQKTATGDAGDSSDGVRSGNLYL